MVVYLSGRVLLTSSIAGLQGRKAVGAVFYVVFRYDGPSYLLARDHARESGSQNTMVAYVRTLYHCTDRLVFLVRFCDPLETVKRKVIYVVIRKPSGAV